MVNKLSTDSPIPPGLSGLTPLFLGPQRVGWIDNSNLSRIQTETSVFGTEIFPGNISCSRVTLLWSKYESMDTFSNRLNSSIRSIYDRDNTGFGNWIEEYAGVHSDFSKEPLFKLQRSAVGLLGVLTTGVHLNIFDQKQNGELRVWIAKRSKTITSYPGSLDQPVAGFLGYNCSPFAKLTDEASDEAGISDEILKDAVEVAEIPFAHRTSDRLQIGRVISFDLEVSSDFQPRSVDNEVEYFQRLSLTTLIDILRSTDDFKFDSKCVAIDFLRRKGIISIHDDIFRNYLLQLSQFGLNYQYKER